MMGVKSVEHMSKLAQELRASMPAQTDHQAASNADFNEGPRSLPVTRSSTAVSGRRAQPGASGRRGMRQAESEMQSLERDYEEVKARYEDLLKQNETLKTDTRRRMESYIRREQRYKSEITGLREELRRATAGLGGGDSGTVMGPLHAMHSQILDGLAGLQDKTKAVLQEQEADLLRAFRARLYDVQMELEAERGKKDDGALEWIERTRTLGKELDWSREEALRLDRTNQALSKENGRLRNQAKAQEEDRQFLLRQLVALKKENGKLRETCTLTTVGGGSAVAGQQSPAASASVPTSPPQAAGSMQGATHDAEGVPRPSTALSVQAPTHPPRPLYGRNGASISTSAPLLPLQSAVRGGGNSCSGGGGGASTSTPAKGVRGAGVTPADAARTRDLQARLRESESRSADIIGRLKKMLEAERRALRALRVTHTRELQARTELEVFLRQCVADVKAQLADTRQRTDLLPEERQRVLELLLSQDRVVTLLYDKTFPTLPAPKSEFQGDLLVDPSERVGTAQTG